MFLGYDSRVFMNLTPETILELQAKVLLERNYQVAPWEAAKQVERITPHFTSVTAKLRYQWNEYMLAFRNQKFEADFMEWCMPQFVLCIQIAYACGFGFSIFNAFVNLESFCAESVAVKSPSLCRDKPLGDTLFYFRVLFFPIFYLLAFMSTLLKIKPEYMQKLVTLENIILCIANIHLYCHIAFLSPGPLLDETVKIFLVALYNTLTTLCASSSLRCKYFFLLATFISVYFLVNLFIYKLPLLAHAQNYVILLLLGLYGTTLAYHCEEEERRYFALMRLTLATMTPMAVENAKVVIEVEQLNDYRSRSSTGTANAMKEGAKKADGVAHAQVIRTRVAESKELGSDEDLDDIQEYEEPVDTITIKLGRTMTRLLKGRGNHKVVPTENVEDAGLKVETGLHTISSHSVLKAEGEGSDSDPVALPIDSHNTPGPIMSNRPGQLISSHSILKDTSLVVPTISDNPHTPVLRKGVLQPITSHSPIIKEGDAGCMKSGRVFLEPIQSRQDLNE
ncbi:hypothetical protein HDV05_003994 [Chytridiales sp. JEL 0842]|nr:hypothetical protein HDV05_003994 [Chytridiales sp. JEL 0842]